jgi:hypothetical protein
MLKLKKRLFNTHYGLIAKIEIFLKRAKRFQKKWGILEVCPMNCQCTLTLTVLLTVGYRMSSKT